MKALFLGDFCPTKEFSASLFKKKNINTAPYYMNSKRRKQPLLQEKIKKPAAPYSRTGGSRTTLGEEALDFRVRNGNGCTSLSMATGAKPDVGDKENRNRRERGIFALK